MCCLCTLILYSRILTLHRLVLFLVSSDFAAFCQLFAVVPLNSLAGTVNVGVPQKYWGTKVEPGAEWCVLVWDYRGGVVGDCNRFMCLLSGICGAVCVCVYMCV